MSQPRDVEVKIFMTDAEAMALAQFMKRVGFSEWRANAVDDDEAYMMRDACDRVASALAESGYSPR